MSLAAFRPSRTDLSELLALAVPLVAVQVGQMAMGVVDTMMVGHVSGAAMAAAALGNIYSFGLVLLAMGVLLILDPLLSQAAGAGDDAAASRAVQRGFVLATVVSIPVAALHLVAAPVFRALGQPEELIPAADGFTFASILGIAPFLYMTVIRQALQARHLIWPILVAMLVANVVNAGLNWVFVFGNLGAPALGAAGSGLSTSLSRWFLAILMAALAWRSVRPLLLPWRRDAFDLRALASLVRRGLPIGVQISLEVGVFNVAGLLIGRMGADALAGHQVTLNIASLTYMVPLGVAMASSVLVGNAIGRGDANAARRSAGAGILCGVGFMVASAVVLLTCARPIALAYNGEDAVLAVALTLIPIAGFFQVFDGIQCVASGVLRGAGEMTIPAIANLAGYWVVGLPVGWWLTSSRGAGPAGLWWGLTLGLAMVAAILAWRTRQVLRGDLRRLDA